MLRGIDIVAIVAIVVCGLLIYSGHDGFIASVLATVVGWYFGRKSVKEEEKNND